MMYPDPSATEFVNTSLLDASPAFGVALQSFACELQTVRLMRLGPGSRIKPHQDFDLAIENGTARIHIPIITNDRVVFTLNGRRVEMEPGSCWYLRLADVHEVHNLSTEARVHLVVDAVANEWLISQLEMAAATTLSES